MGSVNYAEEGEFEAAINALKWTAISSVSQVLKTAVELDLLEIMAKDGPVSASFLAAQLPTKNPDAPAVLDRMLSLLCSFSVLNCTLKNLPDGGVERLYGLTAVSKFFTKDNHGRSFAPLLFLGQSKPFTETWYSCKEAILEGGYPFNKAHGRDLFEHLGKDAAFSKVFNEGMSNYSMVIIDKILEIYNGFHGLQTIVDVGGGLGTTITAIASKYPTLKAINFDLPHVVKNAPSSPGVVHVGGDMFKSVPKGDAIFMKSILHNWADDKCVELLKNCYESLPKNGKVIIADHILPESPDTSLEAQQTYLADVLMFGYIRGAKERTEQQVEALAKQAGFKGLSKICDIYATWIMELHK